MHTLIVWAAQYLLWVMVAAFAIVWLVAENRRGKVDVAITTVVGIVLMVAFLYIAKSVHHDPRPFVENPSIKPFFGHSRDDGFPSDHSLAAALIAVLVIWRHRIVGALLCLAAAAVAWARVAAHVHHLQDVVAGLLLGALAGLIASLVVPMAITRLQRSAAAGKTYRALAGR